MKVSFAKFDFFYYFYYCIIISTQGKRATMSIVINGTESRMEEIREKVKHGIRLTMEDGLFLYESDDLLSIGQLANQVNLQKNGNKVYFIENMSLYFTN